MRLWYLIRDRDEQGGPIGRLAEVIELENGMAIVAWLPQHTGREASVETFESISEALRAHARTLHTWLEPALARAS